MKYVISIDKQVGTNTFNSQFIKSTDDEIDYKYTLQLLEDTFDELKLHQKTTHRTDGEFHFANIELRKG